MLLQERKLTRLGSAPILRPTLSRTGKSVERSSADYARAALRGKKKSSGTRRRRMPRVGRFKVGENPQKEGVLRSSSKVESRGRWVSLFSAIALADHCLSLGVRCLGLQKPFQNLDAATRATRCGACATVGKS